jgi:LuxR family maltose regulon positive regulatory protein
LLRPKLIPPGSSRQLVQRRGLSEWIQAAEHTKFVNICAPAGFGKTTLMVQWISRLRGENQPAAWLTVDETDNDPRRFLCNLFSSIKTHVPAFAPDALEDDIFDTVHSASEILPFLLDSLSTFQQPLTIFLDDFCSIKSPQVLDVIRQILHYLSPGKRLVAAVRLAPKLGLGRLRAKNELVEIGLEDLRLTFEETKQFVYQSQNLDLDEEEVEHLHSLTEGWVTGLQLSTLSAIWQRQHSEAHQPIRAFRLISDYLVEDVLANQSQEVLSFLLQTSILNSLTGPLCDAVTGGTDGYEMLDYLERNNIFVISLDEEHNWYRYHSLFAKFLRSRLERRCGHDKLVALHRAAYEWYSQAGDMLEAAHHAMLTGDVELAAEYMERCALDLVMTGQSSTVFEWGTQLPPEVLDRHLTLQFAYVYALTYQQQFSAAIEVIERIRGLLQRSGGEGFKYFNHLETAEAYAMLCLDRFNDFEQGIEHGLAEMPKLQPNARTGHLPMLLHGASVLKHTAGQFQDALASVWQAYNFLNKKTQLQFLYNVYFEGCIYLAQGRLNETLEVAQPALSKTENSPNRFSVSAVAVAMIEAAVLYETNELAKAEGLLNKYRSVLSNATFPDILIVGFRTLARVRFAQGDRIQAVRYITKLDRYGVARGVPRISAAARLEDIHIRLQCGELQQALRSYADLEDPLSSPLGGRHCMLGNEVETLEVARLRLLIAEHKFTPDLLKAELKKANSCVFMRRRLLLLVLLAKAYYLDGERKQALRILKEALLLAQAEGFVRTFVDEGAPLPHMIREVYKVALAEESKGDRKISLKYLLKILNAMGESAPSCSELKQNLDSSLVEALTDREKSILEKLALGYSSEEMASHLYVSVHTVRYHLRNIYAKLGANSRVQAVALARQLDLIR